MALAVTPDLVVIIKKAKNYQRKYASGKGDKYLEKLHDCKDDFYMMLLGHVGKFNIRPQHQPTIDRLKTYQALSWGDKDNLKEVESCVAELAT